MGGPRGADSWPILYSYYQWVIDVEEDCYILVSRVRGR